jgi:nucleolar GTP-binding protein
VELTRILKVLSELKSQRAFYIELYRVFTGENISVFENILKKSIKQLRSIYNDILCKIDKSKDRSHEAYVMRIGVARMLSIYRRINRRVLKLREFLSELAKMPDVRGDYVVVIAGLPQVGKSTLLSKLTNTKPKIGVYPFTTKTLIAGHINVEHYGKIVLLDSPGVLDSPIEEKNIIEYKTILALRYLADHMIYVFDFTENFYYTPREQFNVFFSLKSVLGDKPITVVLNKVDQLTREQINNTVKLIYEVTGLEPIPISALSGVNLDVVKKILVESFIKKTQH